MNVSFVGLGKLGLPCALATESRGHHIAGTDVSSEVLKNIRERNMPYYEEGAPELLQSSNIRIMDVEHLVQFADIIFIAVQTPHAPGYEGITPLTGERADFDYTFLKTAFQEITEQVEKQGEDKVVIIISTVLPGTVRRELMPLITGTHTKICYNPFFIAMGSAVQDFLNPEFVLFGVEDSWAANKAKEFYRTIHTKPFVSMSVESAELTKVSYNTWISSKIGISNNIMEICHKIPGANVDDVTGALKLATDRIVSTRYMDAGGEDGGACFPPEQLVITVDGPQPIRSINEGTLVLTKEGRFEPVLRRWERYYEGDIIETKIEGMPPSMPTIEHGMFVSFDQRNSYDTYSKRKRITKRATNKAISESLSEITEHRADNLSKGMWIPWPIITEDKKLYIPDHVSVEYCELLGWYMAEGCVEYKKTMLGNPRSVRISFHLSGDEKIEARRIKELLLKLFPPKKEGRGAGAKVTISPHKTANSQTVRYGSVKLGSLFLNDCYKLAATKKMPRWLLYGPDKYLKAALQTMLFGDGHIKKGIITFSTISCNLAYGVMMAIERFGISCNLRWIPERTGKDGQHHSEAYEVRLRNRGEVLRLAKLLKLPTAIETLDKTTERSPVIGNYRFHKIISINKKAYKGMVHNLWVKNTSAYVVPTGLVHNCHPRDAIALSWLARKLDLSYDLYTDLMYARERRTQWFADMIIKEHLKTNHPIVILGQAFKPEVGMITGSAGVLLKNVLNRRGYSVLAYDPLIDDAPLYDGDKYIYFVATKHEVFKNYKFHPGSIVFDPFRYISKQDGVTLIPIGA